MKEKQPKNKIKEEEEKNIKNLFGARKLKKNSTHTASAYGL